MVSLQQRSQRRCARSRAGMPLTFLSLILILTQYTVGHPLSHNVLLCFLSEEGGCQLHNACSISTTASGMCQKCFTKHHNTADAPECSSIEGLQYHHHRICQKGLFTKCGTSEQTTTSSSRSRSAIHSWPANRPLPPRRRRRATFWAFVSCGGDKCARTNGEAFTEREREHNSVVV